MKKVLNILGRILKGAGDASTGGVVSAVLNSKRTFFVYKLFIYSNVVVSLQYDKRKHKHKRYELHRKIRLKRRKRIIISNR